MAPWNGTGTGISTACPTGRRTRTTPTRRRSPGQAARGPGCAGEGGPCRSPCCWPGSLSGAGGAARGGAGRPGPALAAQLQERDQLLGRGHGAVVAGEGGLGGVDLTLDDADGAGGGGDHVPDPGAGVVGDLGAEPAGGDRLLAGDDPHGVAEQAAPAGQDVVGGALPGVDVPGPGLAGQEADPGGQLGLVGQVYPLLGAKV